MTMAKALTTTEIMKIIPHRHPFLLIDKVDDYEPGEYCIGYKNFTYDEYFFRGHFPEMPIAVFAGIDKCKFKTAVVPGDTVRLETRITAIRGPVGFGEAVASVNGKVAVQAVLKFAILQ